MTWCTLPVAWVQGCTHAGFGLDDACGKASQPCGSGTCILLLLFLLLFRCCLWGWGWGRRGLRRLGRWCGGLLLYRLIRLNED